MASPYRSNRNVVFSRKFHIVWCPKYRRSVLVDGADERLKKIIARVCNESSRYATRIVFPKARLIAERDPSLCGARQNRIT
jgi:REP-associated tyrosine transposase